MSNKNRVIKKYKEEVIDYSKPVFFSDYFTALSEMVRLRKSVHKVTQKTMSEKFNIGLNTLIRFENATDGDDAYINYELMMKYFSYFGLKIQLYVEPNDGTQQDGWKGQIV